MTSGSDPGLKDVESQGHGKRGEVLSCSQLKIEVWCPESVHCPGAAAFHPESDLFLTHLPTLGTLLQGLFSSVGRQHSRNPSQAYPSGLTSVPLEGVFESALSAGATAWNSGQREGGDRVRAYRGGHLSTRKSLFHSPGKQT